MHTLLRKCTCSTARKSWYFARTPPTQRMIGATDFCVTMRVRVTVSEVHSVSTMSDSEVPSPIVFACRKSACVRSIRFSIESAEVESKRTVRCV